VLVDDAQVHQQVRRELLVLEVFAPQWQPGSLGGVRASASSRLPAPNSLSAMNASAYSGRRHQARARPLRQGLGERDDLFLQHPGTSHSQRSSLAGLRAKIGSVTVTPSRALPGS
jgi:hypothetical protein